MKERPILFSGPMVRAILEGRKTQTRRTIKLPAGNWTVLNTITPWHTTFGKNIHESTSGVVADAVFNSRCRHGLPLDRLWVKETWAAHFIWQGVKPSEISVDDRSCFFYRADGAIVGGCLESQREKNWRPSIFMPRAMSRITLEIVSLRVERLKSINRGDAMAEGCPFPNMAKGPDPRQWYAELWDEINGAGAWDKNPWVWVIEFRKI